MPRRSRNIKPNTEILVLRSEDDFEERDFSRFHEETIRILDLQALSFQFLRWRPQRDHYDYLVVTSPRAVQSLTQVMESESLQVDEVVLIGKKTMRVFKEKMNRRFWKRLHTVDEANRRGILKALKGAEGSVLYPHSSLVEPWLVAAFRKSKLRIESRIVYKTRVMALRRRLKNLLSGDIKLPLAILVTSPSLFAALQASFTPEELRQRRPLFMCLGDTTSRFMRKAGFRVRKSSEASVETALQELISHCKSAFRQIKPATHGRKILRSKGHRRK